MGAFKNAITKLRHGLAKVTPQGSHLQHPEPFTDGDVVDEKEQPGRGPAAEKSARWNGNGLSKNGDAFR